LNPVRRAKTAEKQKGNDTILKEMSYPKNLRKQTVVVWNVSYEIITYQNSPSVWFAVGDYMGESINVKASSASAAANKWREAARYRENLGIPPRQRGAEEI
jgi:hypothetical protein